MKRLSLARRASAFAIFAASAAAGVARADPPPQAPAPLGVFGVDMPARGKFVVSFLPSYTRMQGSLIGTTSVSPQFIVSNVISPYTPVGTHLLRMVPKKADIDSQSFAVAYGLTSDITLFASASLLEKDVNMQAFQGLGGLTSLGFSDGRTSGFGDTTVAAIWRVHRDRANQLNFNIGVSLPSGATTDDINLLLPNATAPAKRGFYAMQPGSGTVDLLPGMAYSGVSKAWSWGGSLRARLPLDTSAEGWRYGDQGELNAWTGYSWRPGLEATFRVNATTQGRIRGFDPGITGYAQGSDPMFYGGQQVGLFGGVIVGGRYLGVNAATLGLEAGAPVYQRLNGPQLGRDWQVSAALRYKL